jgi:hypothetical protein
MLKMCLCNLQRISIGYLLAAMSEIWLVNNNMVDSPATFVRKYYIQWLVLLVRIYNSTCHVCNMKLQCRDIFGMQIC